jgi:hypothetical protein
VVVVVAAAIVVVSGGSDADPRTPPALAGMPPPFLGTAVSGDGAMTAAVDAYGDVVDLRPSPAGPALIDNPAARQAAGTVPADTGIVPKVSVDGGAALPLWEADAVAQRYLRGTNVVRTVARFGRTRAVVTVAATEETLAMAVVSQGALPSVSVNVEGGVRCARDRRAGQLDLLCRVGRAVPPVSNAAAGDVREEAAGTIRSAVTSDRQWLGSARPLDATAPAWARRMCERSLLVLHALTDRRTGAVAAGARDGWAYVWPRDAATAALAFTAAGYGAEARQIVDFLAGLDLSAAARFDGDGAPIPGRGPQGDALGWLAVAARAAGETISIPSAVPGLPDYQEGSRGDYLGNAIAVVGGEASAESRAASRGGVASIERAFGTRDGLVRVADDPASGLDSAAAWAVQPFALAPLYPSARRTLLNLSAERTRFGITPGSGWTGGVDPWSAPTAWTAWALAALDDRHQALRLLADLRRAATPAGSLPERVDAETGVPRSTTPLAWTHAFAILALRELWPAD